MTKKLAVIVLSGGMDSSLCTAIAAAEGFELACLHINYGQRTEARELKAFHDICDHYQVTKRLVVDIHYLAAIGGSSLTDMNIAVDHAQLDRTDIPTSYVPFRNANILSIATSWAEVIKADSIWIGAVQDDSSGYPDCRSEFFQAFERVINLGTAMSAPLSIRTPVLHLSKAQIVRKGCELKLPFEQTWSCYQSGQEACGVCDSCALRLRGFEEAAETDPLPYTTRPSYR